MSDSFIPACRSRLHHIWSTSELVRHKICEQSISPSKYLFHILLRPPLSWLFGTYQILNVPRCARMPAAPSAVERVAALRSRLHDHNPRCPQVSIRMLGTLLIC